MFCGAGDFVHVSSFGNCKLKAFAIRSPKRNLRLTSTASFLWGCFTFLSCAVRLLKVERTVFDALHNSHSEISSRAISLRFARAPFSPIGSFNSSSGSRLHHVQEFCPSAWQVLANFPQANPRPVVGSSQSAVVVGATKRCQFGA
jgi:hypothetical protein